MTILFIGKRYYTNRDALEERYGRIYQIPWHWAAEGAKTRLWLIDYHNGGYRRDVDDGLDIYSTPVPGLEFFWQSCRELMAAVRRTDRPKLVVGSGDCYIGLLGYVIARCVRARFVFDMYDKYDEFAGYRKLLGLDPQSLLLRRADAVMFASVALKRRLAGLTKKCVVVPNGIDTGHFRPLDRLASRHDLGLPPDVAMVGYFGSMEQERGIADLIDAVGHIRQSGADVELLIGGEKHPDISMDRPWIRYLGNIPFDRVPPALACCDVLALPYRNSPFLDMASSCKIAEYIAVDRPIVATRTPNLVENFPDQARELEGVHALPSPNNPAELADSIRRQLDERHRVSMPADMDWPSISSVLRRFLDHEFGEIGR